MRGCEGGMVRDVGIKNCNGGMSLNKHMVSDGGTDVSECDNKVINRRKVAESIKPWLNKKELSRECGRMVHENLADSNSDVLYTSKTIVWKEREK